MQDRDALISSLTAIARRMRLTSASRELAWAACAISGGFVVYQILATVIASPSVMGGLKALLVLLLIAIVGFYAARCARPLTLAQAAAASDTRADLSDELKTAYWFAGQGDAFPRGDAAPQGDAAPLIDLQIRRAVLVAQKLNPSKLFVITIPRSAFAAAGLGLAAGLLAWFSPRFEYAPSPAAQTIATVSNKASTDARTGQALPEPPAKVRDEQDNRENEAAWAKLETTTRSLGQSQELNAVAAMIKSRDATRAAQLLEEFSRKRAFAQAQAAGRTLAVSGRASPDLLARLKDLFSSGGDAPQPAQDGSANDPLARALDLAQRLAEDASSRANNPATHTADEATNNPLQAAVPLERFGPRETRRSQTQGGEFAGTTDVEGGAMGRRVTQTSIGAGGKPSSNETSDNNNIEAEAVIGKRTMRLAAKLERVKIEGNNSEGDGAQGFTDSIYAATRAQQAQLDYQNAPRQARYVSESAMSGERVPLAYRGAVKDYFLNLNRKEP